MDMKPASSLMEAYLITGIGPIMPTYAVVPRTAFTSEQLAVLPDAPLYAITPDGVKPIYDDGE